MNKAAINVFAYVFSLHIFAFLLGTYLGIEFESGYAIVTVLLYAAKQFSIFT